MLNIYMAKKCIHQNYVAQNKAENYKDNIIQELKICDFSVKYR